MLLAAVNALTFKIIGSRHTVDYAEKCGLLAFDGREKQAGNLRAVLAETVEEAAEKLRKQLRAVLKNCYWGPKPEDFTFDIVYSEEYEGGFWLPLSMYQGRGFAV